MGRDLCAHSPAAAAFCPGGHHPRPSALHARLRGTARRTDLHRQLSARAFRPRPRRAGRPARGSGRLSRHRRRRAVAGRVHRARRRRDVRFCHRAQARRGARAFHGGSLPGERPARWRRSSARKKTSCAASPPRRTSTSPTSIAPARSSSPARRNASPWPFRMAKRAGVRKAVPLNVAGAYHSRLMDPAYMKLGDALLHTVLQTPQFPVVSNVDARAGGRFRRDPPHADRAGHGHGFLDAVGRIHDRHARVHPLPRTRPGRQAGRHGRPHPQGHGSAFGQRSGIAGNCR